jgi:choice-of-anchor B domain-containing protein
MLSLRSLGGLGVAFVLGTSAIAHDDDLKLAARELPYRGPGWTSPLDGLGRLRSGAGAMQPLGASCDPTFCSSDVRLLSWMPLADLGGASAASNCWGYASPGGREYALIGLSNGTAIVDVTTPGNPSLVVHLPGPSSSWRDLKTYGTWAYAVSEGGGGLQVYDLSQVDSGAVFYQGEQSRNKTHNVAVDLDSGFLYRAGGGRDGLHIYDLKLNPAFPPLVGAWNDQYVHDAQVRTFTTGPAAGKQVAFCCSGDEGTLHTLDVTVKGKVRHMDEVTYPNAAFSHQVWLSEDGRYAYVNDEYDEPSLTTSTYVFDVYDPWNITYLGSFTNGNPAVGHNAYVRGDKLYAANYRSGLRVFDLAQSPTSPPEVAWFDTYPDNDDPLLNSLWGCYPFLPSGIVIGSDTVRGMFVWWVGEPQIQFDFMAPQPSALNAEGDTLTLRITPSAAVQPGTAMLHYDAGAGPVALPLVPLGGDLWNAVFPALPCGTQVTYYFSATSTTNIPWTSPEDVPYTRGWTAQVHCPSQPFTYCVARENSCGLLPAIRFEGASSAAATSGFTVSADGARDGKPGLLLYTNQGVGSAPLLGGTLCLWPKGVRRTPLFSAANGTPGQCDAEFTIDVNAFGGGLLGGNPKPYLLVPGTRINVQMWGRDVLGSSFLSNAGQYLVGP